MHEGGAKQPDIVSLNVNMWYWFRKSKERASRDGGAELGNAGWADRATFVRNLTAMVGALRRWLPEASVWTVPCLTLPYLTLPYVAAGGVRLDGAPSLPCPDLPSPPDL